MNRTTTFHIELIEGSDYSESFVYQDPVTTLPVDLTGWSADLKVRIAMNGTYDGYSTPDYVIELGTSTGEIVLGDTTGSVTINISADKTTGLNWNRAVYTLMLTDTGGKKHPLFEGFFTILGSTI